MSGRIILHWDLKKKGVNTRNWVDSAQDKHYWKALLNTALSLLVSFAIKLEGILYSKEMLLCQNPLSSSSHVRSLSNMFFLIHPPNVF